VGVLLPVENYEEEVLDFVGKNGFQGEWKGPIETNQEGCSYEEELQYDNNEYAFTQDA